MFSFSVRRLIGAVAVVCLGVSAVVVGSVAVPAQTLALPGASESTVVTIEPTRVTDTRYDIGLTGQIAVNKPRKFTVTGPIDTYIDSTSTTVVKQVVPAGATGVFLNVTVVTPSEPGFLAIRPGTATGVPATAGLNFDRGTVLANGILVALPTTGGNAGEVDIYYGSTAGAFTDLIVDVVGYTTSSGLIDLAKRVETLETSSVAGATGPAGAQGEQGPAGAQGSNGPAGAQGSNGPAGAQGSNGPAGAQGIQGAPGLIPAQVVWVAKSGGDYTSLSVALDSIIDADKDKPYVVKIAPGRYKEISTVVLKSYVDVEGSGQGATTINCVCGSDSLDGSSAAVSAGVITAEIRHLTINSTGSGSVNRYSSGVYTNGVSDGSFSMLHVTATATGSPENYAVYNDSSEPSMLHVTATATATGAKFNYGVYNNVSSPSMTNVTATATGSPENYAVANDAASPSMTNVTATATGGSFNYGVGNLSSSSPSIRNSSITGTTNSIFNSELSSAKVANTVLSGVVKPGAGLTCVGVYDTDFVAFGC
jgi:hypothetical protein